jgi:hypothetical protein
MNCNDFAPGRMSAASSARLRCRRALVDRSALAAPSKLAKSGPGQIARSRWRALDFGFNLSRLGFKFRNVIKGLFPCISRRPVQLFNSIATPIKSQKGMNRNRIRIPNPNRDLVNSRRAPKSMTQKDFLSQTLRSRTRISMIPAAAWKVNGSSADVATDRTPKGEANRMTTTRPYRPADGGSDLEARPGSAPPLHLREGHSLWRRLDRDPQARTADAVDHGEVTRPAGQPRTSPVLEAGPIELGGMPTDFLVPTDLRHHRTALPVDEPRLARGGPDALSIASASWKSLIFMLCRLVGSKIHEHISPGVD